jgi:cell division protein FtsB
MILKCLCFIFYLLLWRYDEDYLNKEKWTKRKKEIDKLRSSLERQLENNKSLKEEISDIITERYERALNEVEGSLTIDNLSQECPFTDEQIMDKYYYPAF